MNTASLIVDQLVLLSFVALMIWAALSDLRSYSIPNKVCLAIAAIYPAHVLASPVPVDWKAGLIVGGIVLVIGFICFVFKWTGAGDVKLLAAGSLWAGSDQIAPYLFVIALAGGALSLGMMIWARYVNSSATDGVSTEARFTSLLQTHVPYGAAIAVGGLYVALQRFAF